jgi:hypothetical protein
MQENPQERKSFQTSEKIICMGASSKAEISSIPNLVILARIKFGVFMQDVKVFHNNWINLRNVSCSYFFPEPRNLSFPLKQWLTFSRLPKRPLRTHPIDRLNKLQMLS